MPYLYFDSETYSECDLKTHGTPRYARHPSTEVTVLQYAIDDLDPIVIDCTRMDSRDKLALVSLKNNLADEDNLIVAHNSFFDRTILREVMGISLPPERWRDTMVQALCHGMPGGLDKIGEALGLPVDERKDKRGAQLVQLFCKPLPKNQKLRRATRHTHPEQWAEFLEYSDQDIVSMRAIHRRLPSFNYAGKILEQWWLDQLINDRGFAVDIDLAQAAIRAIGDEKLRLKAETLSASFNEVESATQRDKLLAHILAAYGVSLPDLTADTLRRRIDDENLPEGVRLLLTIRLESSKASTAKYAALIKHTDADHRLRCTLQFSGASRTLRWAGRTFQPQNLPRPTMKADMIEAGIAALKLDMAEFLFPVMDLTSNALRGCIVAPKGRKLTWADLSNIEGRKLAWLAGEHWKIKAFADFDAGIGFDLYKVAYARAMNIPVEDVDDDMMRQIGKVMELALGYEGGVGAFVTFAAVYKLDLNALADAVWEITPAEELHDALDTWEWAIRKNKTLELEKKVYVACEVLKRAWRAAHPATTKLWKDSAGAFRMAIQNKKEWIPINDKLACRVDNNWLRIRLPSGRYIPYLAPRIDEHNNLSYMGVDPYTRRWRRILTHGGKIVENIDQGSSRDVMAEAMVRIEDAGYPIVLSVHDEVITEPDDIEVFNKDELAKLLAAGEHWTKGLPLAAKGTEAYRYRK